MFLKAFDLKFSDERIALISHEFAAALEAGFLLPEAVRLVLRETSDRRIRQMLEFCNSKLSEGYGLYEALLGYGKAPEVFVKAIGLGERYGRLGEVFEYLGKYYRDRHRVRKKVITAVRYPAIIFIFSMIIMGAITAYLFPWMMSFFEGYGVDTPLPVRLVSETAKFIFVNRFVAAAFLGIFMLALSILFGTERGRVISDRLKLCLPVVGRILKFSLAEQFAKTAYLLVSAGLDLPEILEEEGKALGNRALEREMSLGAAALKSGASPTQILSSSRYLPPMICEMASVGAETGTLEKTMKAAGEYYDKETVIMCDSAIAALEPALTVIMGLFAAFIVILVYASVLSMYNAFDGADVIGVLDAVSFADVIKVWI